MTHELKNKQGEIFWSDECADALAAINFALDDIDDDSERQEFLKSWREGDIAPWPEFLKKVQKK